MVNGRLATLQAKNSLGTLATRHLLFTKLLGLSTGKKPFCHHLKWPPN